jgi:hypothetical protein
MQENTEAPKPEIEQKPEEEPKQAEEPIQTIKPKKAASPIVVAIAVIALGVGLFFMADFTFGPLLPPPDPFGGMSQGEWVQKLARETEGDFNKLSPANQKQMNGISRGNGARYLKVAYEKLTKEPSKPKEEPKP